MSDTNDLVEQMARAMRPLTWKHYDQGAIYSGLRERLAESLIEAEDALAVAEPAIRADERRKVIEELIEAGSDCYLYISGEAHQPWLPDWLRAQVDPEPETKKIYIKG